MNNRYKFSGIFLYKQNFKMKYKFLKKEKKKLFFLHMKKLAISMKWYFFILLRISQHFFEKTGNEPTLL